jgi:hypothetical protein
MSAAIPEIQAERIIGKEEQPGDREDSKIV